MLYNQWLFLKIGGLSVCQSVLECECAACRPLPAFPFGTPLYIRPFTLYIPLKVLVVDSMARFGYTSAAVIALVGLAVAAPTPLARRGLFAPSGRS